MSHHWLTLLYPHLLQVSREGQAWLRAAQQAGQGRMEARTRLPVWRVGPGLAPWGLKLPMSRPHTPRAFCHSLLENNAGGLAICEQEGGSGAIHLGGGNRHSSAQARPCPVGSQQASPGWLPPAPSPSPFLHQATSRAFSAHCPRGLQGVFWAQARKGEAAGPGRETAGTAQADWADPTSPAGGGLGGPRASPTFHVTVTKREAQRCCQSREILLPPVRMHRPSPGLYEVLTSVVLLGRGAQRGTSKGEPGASF